MSVVINGILNRKLPWGLVLLGVFLVITVELLGVRSLELRRRLLPLHRHHRGHLLRRRGPLAGRAGAEKKGRRGEQPRALFASGLIAAGGIVGPSGHRRAPRGHGKEIDDLALLVPRRTGTGSEKPSGLNQNPVIAMLVFAALGFSLFYFARKPLGDSK